MISENWIYLGTAIGALGAAVYLRDTLRGTTSPNRVTWLLWAVAPLLAAAIELNDGVGLRALPTFMVGFMPLLVFLGSFHNSSSVWRIRRLDYACGLMSVVGTVIWLVTRSGVLALSAAIAADFLAGVPTLTKSWTHPETETVHSYAGALVSMVIALLTIEHWNFEVAAFPAFIVAISVVQVVLIGFEPGPRLRRAAVPGRKAATAAPGTAALEREPAVPTAHANGIDIAYVTDGDPAGPPLLLVMGLGAQLLSWPQGFVDALCGHGFYVIRYDNRDCGLSTKFEGVPEFAALFAGDTSSAPYRVEDMADDAAALLAELRIDQAHVVGASMGGMITQALAIHHGAHVLSACSIMSTTGDRSVGAPTAEATAALLRPAATSRHEAIEASLEGSRAIGSPAYPTDEQLLRQRAAAAYDRGYCPDGTARQLAAILASPDRTEGLRALHLPFLVVHGEDDPLVTLSGGQATAAAVPGATLLVVPGMGHDLPEQLWPQLVDAIVANTALAAV